MDPRTKLGLLFSKLRIPANAWTVLIIIPGILSLYFLLNNQFIYAGIAFLVAIVIDIIDGAVAEVTTKITPKGAFLDETVTMYLETFVLFGLFCTKLPDFFLPARMWAFLALLGFLGMEYASKAAKFRGLIEKDRVHLVIKPTRIGLLLVIVFLAGYDTKLSVALLAVTAIISLIAMVNRQIKALVQ